MCGRRYKAKYGQLVEFLINNQPHWALADIPPNGVEDLRAMAKEKELDVSATAEEIYRQIQQYTPVTGEILRPATPADMWHGGDCSMVAMLTPEGKRALEATPKFQWYQIFNFMEPAARR